MTKKYKSFITIVVLMVLLFQYDQIFPTAAELNGTPEHHTPEEFVDYEITATNDSFNDGEDTATALKSSRKSVISLSENQPSIGLGSPTELIINEENSHDSDSHDSDSHDSERLQLDLPESRLAKEDESQSLELPALSQEHILPVDLKILTQKGRANIVTIDDEIYLDISSLARYYGKLVTWDEEKGQFFCKLFGVELIGSSLQYEIFVNGNSVTLNKPVYVIENITYLPIESFAEELGAEASYEDQLLEFKIRNIAKAAFKLFRS